jgi:carboxypeptidase C (cathepsin A)
MKVLVLAGYYDLATPYFAADYSFHHMGLHAEMHKNISWQFYHAGHMLYTDTEAHAKMKQDVANFIRSVLPEH